MVRYEQVRPGFVMPENYKLKLRGLISRANHYIDREPYVLSEMDIVVSSDYIDSDPWSDRIFTKNKTITLKNFDLQNVIGAYNNGYIDIDISIPVLTQYELKKKKLESEIQDIEKRLAKLAPMKEEIAALESKLKDIKEDCSGN